MFSRIWRVSGPVSIGNFEQLGSLLICEADAELWVPPIERCNHFHVSVLPLSGARVSIRASETGTKITAGDELAIEFDLVEQHIVTLLAVDRWLLMRS